MNKKFLKEHYLEKFRDQYMRLAGLKEASQTNNNKKVLNEWSFIPNNLEEDDDEDNDPSNPMPQDPQMGGNGQEQPMPMGIGANDGHQGMGGDDMQGGADAEDNVPQVAPPNTDAMGDEPPMVGGLGDDADTESSNEDEIDVTELTDAQEKLNKKINSVGKDVNRTDISIDKLMNAINNISDIIDSNNAKIDDLKREIEKRNPTPLEKMDLRSVDSSQPYNLRPNDFWKNKLQSTDNYTEYDENDPYSNKKKEYVITTDDISDTNPSDIQSTFDDLDADFKKFLGI